MKNLVLILIVILASSFHSNHNLKSKPMPQTIQGSDAAPIWYCAYEIIPKTVVVYMVSNSGTEILDISGDIKIPGSVTPETPNGINKYACVIDSVSKQHMLDTLTELGVTDPNVKIVEQE